MMVKNGPGLLSLGMKWDDVLHADENLGKLKVTLIIIG